MKLAFTLILLVSMSAARAAAYPDTSWSSSSPADAGMDEQKLQQAREYALTGRGSGSITRHGKLVLAWGSSTQLFDLKSSTKAIGITALGLAIKDGKMRLRDQARRHHATFGVPPEANAQTGWLEKITLWHLATQTAGFEKPGGYTNLLFEPGTKWHYSDGGPNWLAECLTLAYAEDLRTLLFDRVFTPIGIKPADLAWRENSYRPRTINGIKRREIGSGISANVDAMARIGYLYLREGRWKNEQILTKDFIDIVRAPVRGVVGLPEHDPKNHGNASDHYGLLWWNNGDGTIPDVPKDAYWSWGLYDSLIVVIPSLDIVVARAGSSWRRQSGDHYDVLKPFLGPIAQSVTGSRAAAETQAPPALRGAQHFTPRTRISLIDGKWHINREITYRGARAEGLLMNVRMVNATFEDRNRPEFDPEVNTDRFIARIPDYAAHGVRAFTLCLQGGMPGYERAVNSAFAPDGSLRETYMKRVRRVIEACDRQGIAVILGCYYQRQDQILEDAAAVRAGVVNVVKWIQACGFQNVVLEIANEFGHGGFDHRTIKTPEGEVELIRLAKQHAPDLLVSTSGLGGGRLPDIVAEASDFLLIHFNETPLTEIPKRIAALKRFGKPIVCNEDDKTSELSAQAAELCVANGASWGLMLSKLNQYFPFAFNGAEDAPIVYSKLKELTSSPGR